MENDNEGVGWVILKIGAVFVLTLCILSGVTFTLSSFGIIGRTVLIAQE
jgi:hypothetical protein